MNSVEEKIMNLWEQGYTTSKIAAEVGRTKNSICGLLFRMRQKGINVVEKRGARPNPQKTKDPKPRSDRPKIIKSKPYKRANAPVSKNSLNITFWKLKNNSCRYILNDGPAEGFIYCGAPKERGPYCESHALVCYLPPKMNEKKTPHPSQRSR